MGTEFTYREIQVMNNPIFKSSLSLQPGTSPYLTSEKKVNVEDNNEDMKCLLKNGVNPLLIIGRIKIRAKIC
jgi:hypothetical protein